MYHYDHNLPVTPPPMMPPHTPTIGATCTVTTTTYKTPPPPPPPLPPLKEKRVHILAHDPLNMFCLNYLKKATNNFKHRIRSTIGGGEFGEVFEGEFVIRYYKCRQICEDRRRVAIKKFRHYKIQKRMNANGIIKAVDITFLSKLNHPKLVKVLGYCFEDETLFLIYEFMENGSLDSHLFTKDKIPLSWKTRVQIAKGIAETLLNLNSSQNKVNDFSIKIHQILLDKNFNPKISDLESAKLAYGDSFDKIEHSYNSEYTGIVRSFGVLLMQLITGERISDVGIANLRQTMWDPKGEVRKESLNRALDPRLSNKDDTTITEAMKLALDCVANPFFPLMKVVNVLAQINYRIIKCEMNI